MRGFEDRETRVGAARVARGRHERVLLVEQSRRPAVVICLLPADALEHDDAELRAPHEDELVAALDLVGDLLREVDGARDRLAIDGGAVGREGEPEGQAAGAAREVRGEVGRAPVARLGQGVEVLGVLRVRAAAEIGVAVDERARVERREQPLVRVDDERVGAFDPCEAVP